MLVSIIRGQEDFRTVRRINSKSAKTDIQFGFISRHADRVNDTRTRSPYSFTANRSNRVIAFFCGCRLGVGGFVKLNNDETSFASIQSILFQHCVSCRTRSAKKIDNQGFFGS